MNTLLIEKKTGGYFKFTLNGDTANAITSINNDLLAVGNQLHFKTGNGANIVKEQFIYPADVTIVSGGTFTFTTVAQVWDKLIAIDYFAWLGGGGTGGVDRFDDLLDTFSYTGNAGKAVVVDNSELKLVPITLYNKRLFTELEDTPSSLVPDKMVVVNPAGTALIFQDQPEPPAEYLNSVGYFDYNDLATQTTPLNAVANVALKLTNDTEGANTSTDQNPYGVSYVWDYVANQFNFSELEVGDTIDVRVHVQITTTTSNQKVSLSAKFGIGSVAEFTNSIFETTFKSSGLHEISFVAPFYMGSTYITDYPAELYLTTDASATVKVDGWYVRILRKNINIITVDYQVEDATTTTKGIVRLAGDLSGTANNPIVPELANKVPTSRTVSTTSPLLGGGALSSNLSLSIQQSNSVDSGYLSNVDWITFNGKANDNAVVKLTGDQSIAGNKTFTTEVRTIFQNGDAAQITFKNTGDLTKTLNIGHGSNGNIFSSTGLDFRVGGLTSSALLIASNENATFKENLTAKSFIKSGGTSSQFLKADGSVDSNNYALTSQLHDAVTIGTTGILNGLSLSGQVLSLATASSTTRGALTAEDYNYFFAKQNALTNPVTGTGTTNYIPKFTGSSAIGNSLIFDNGQVNIGSTSFAGDELLMVSMNGTTNTQAINVKDRNASGNGSTFMVFRKSDDTFLGNIRRSGTSDALYIGGNSFLALGVGGNTEAMRIASSGNVGIGTTSPDYKLSVNGSSSFGASPINGNPTNDFSIFRGISISDGSAAYGSYGGFILSANTQWTGSAKRFLITNVLGANKFGIIRSVDAGTNPSIGVNGVVSSGTADFVINDTGNISIGTTTDAGYKLDVNGNVRATGFFNSSDNRLKDLTDYDYNVSDIKPITYLWKDGRDNKKHVGYSAQEVQKVMPDAVNEGADGFLSVNYVEVLVAKIEAMEKEIAYLKSK